MAKNTDKCYTKKNKSGGSYTTCVDKGGKQLRGTKTKDTKEYKKVLKATKKVEKEDKDKDIKTYKKVLKATKKFEKDQDKDIMMYKKMMKKMKDPKVIRNVSETMSAQSSSAGQERMKSEAELRDFTVSFLERKEKEKRMKNRRELRPSTATGNDQWDSLADMERQDLLDELMR